MTSDLDNRLEAAVQANDRYRSRARAVATLSAAAAGALSAGLIFTPADALPEAAQLFGLISIILLIASTGLNVAASASTSYRSDITGCKKLMHTFEIWRVRVEARKNNGQESEHGKLIAEAQILQTGISRLMSLGLWLAALSAIALIISLVIMTFSGDTSRQVTIELRTPLDSTICPGMDRVISGEVWDSDRKSKSTLLPIVVSPKDCRNADGATIYVDKASVAVITEGA